MRKALFVLFTVSLAFVLACNSQPTSNGNVARNINGNVNVNARRPPRQLEVILNITHSTGSPFQLLIDGPNSGDPGDVRGAPIQLVKEDTIYWKVNYIASGSAPNIKVGIDNFRDEKTSKSDPFGTLPEHNKFDLGVLSTTGPTAQMATQPAHPDKTGTFKYRITIEVSGTIKLVLDPIIIITTFN